MKLKELTKSELQQINGGNTSNSTIGASVSTQTLLSLNYDWNNGHGDSYQSSLQVGKNIQTGIGAGNNSVHN